jgi:hypothetical protein
MKLIEYIFLKFWSILLTVLSTIQGSIPGRLLARVSKLVVQKIPLVWQPIFVDVVKKHDA